MGINRQTVSDMTLKSEKNSELIATLSGDTKCLLGEASKLVSPNALSENAFWKTAKKWFSNTANKLLEIFFGNNVQRRELFDKEFLRRKMTEKILWRSPSMETKSRWRKGKEQVRIFRKKRLW